MSPRLRKPNGIPNWPMILLEGPDSVGKSYQAAQFTGSPKTGQAYWLDVGEGAADEYINVPGADYMIVDHDGSWQDILHQISEISVAEKDAKKPAVLIVDSASNVWDMLKSWVNARARNSKNGKRTLAADPDAEIKPSPNLWNDANDRHAAFVTALARFPGIVVLTARGKETMAVDGEGRPIQGQRDYSVEANKSLPFKVNAHVRLSREDAPVVVSFRSATNGLRPGVDKPQKYPDFSLEHLVFEVMGLEKAQAPDVTELVTDEKALADAARAELRAWCEANGMDLKAVADRFYESQEETLGATGDASAVRNLLQSLQDEHAKQVAS